MKTVSIETDTLQPEIYSDNEGISTSQFVVNAKILIMTINTNIVTTNNVKNLSEQKYKHTKDINKRTTSQHQSKQYIKQSTSTHLY